MNKEIDETITFIDIFLKNIELQNRIDKAIELLKKYKEANYYVSINELLEILKGEEQNEKEK